MKKGSFEKFQTKRVRNLPSGICTHQDSFYRQTGRNSAGFGDFSVRGRWREVVRGPDFFLHSLLDSIESPLPVCEFLHGDRSPRRNWGRTKTQYFRFYRPLDFASLFSRRGERGVRENHTGAYLDPDQLSPSLRTFQVFILFFCKGPVADSSAGCNGTGHGNGRLFLRRRGPANG